MKSLRVAITGAALPVALAAQQAAAPQANPITAAFKARLAANHRNIAQAFDSIPTIDAKDTSTPDSVKATWPQAELVSKLKASFAFCDQAIEQITDATHAGAMSFTLDPYRQFVAARSS